MTFTIADIRRRGLMLITLGSGAVTLCLLVVGMTANPNVLYGALVSALLTAIAGAVQIKGRTDFSVRFAMALALAMQCGLLTMFLHGSHWQDAIYLCNFLALGLLVPLCDSRPIIAAGATMILFHLTVEVVAKQIATGVHSSAFMEMFLTLALVGFCVCMARVSRTLGKVACLAEDFGQQAEQMGQKLVAAEDLLSQVRADYSTEQQTNARNLSELREAHRIERARLFNEIERSVGAVIGSVTGTAELLQRTAHQLKEMADETGSEADSVLGSAEDASKAANTVAAGVAELSMSIAEIAASVGKQSQLAMRATERSDGGGKAIGSLSDQSQTIGKATRAIVRIAERTNLLSLNAAIEAASAGPSGRGFNIVANEVKVLADQASRAATEIDTFLQGVQSGTIEAERCFDAIDGTIGELNKAAVAIRYDVENQRQSADTIESFARRAATGAEEMVDRVRALTNRANSARALSVELDHAAGSLAENVRALEQSTNLVTDRLQAA